MVSNPRLKSGVQAFGRGVATYVLFRTKRESPQPATQQRQRIPHRRLRQSQHRLCAAQCLRSSYIEQNTRNQKTVVEGHDLGTHRVILYFICFNQILLIPARRQCGLGNGALRTLPDDKKSLTAVALAPDLPAVVADRYCSANGAFSSPEIQALVLLPIDQMLRYAAAGLNTLHSSRDILYRHLVH